MNEGAGDWICSDPSCGNINFARRMSCYRCNKDRPDGGKMFKKKLGTEIGKSAAEKSRGLFNADDWQCNKCANVNWARRTTCNVCNAPKFGEVEARTGYGGGYNERGVVEYRRREPSSDDEYDEFGRKKRKRKLDGQNVSKASASTGEGEGAEEEAEAGQEGDEEESGDDADLSKYDLWGSDDEKAHTSKTETTDKTKDGEETEAVSVGAEKNGKSDTVENKTSKRRRSSSSSSSTSSSSSSSRSSTEAPKNKFDDFNLNSERESSPGHRARSPHSRGSGSGSRRKPRSRSGADSRSHESGRDKQKSRSRERRERRGSRSRSRSRPARKERRYSRDGAPNHYAARGRHR